MLVPLFLLVKLQLRGQRRNELPIRGLSRKPFGNNGLGQPELPIQRKLYSPSKLQNYAHSVQHLPQCY